MDPGQFDYKHGIMIQIPPLAFEFGHGFGHSKDLINLTIKAEQQV